MSNSQYRWAYAHLWLEEACRDWDADRLRIELLRLASVVDGECLEDLYESEMEDDGYFEQIPTSGTS